MPLAWSLISTLLGKKSEKEGQQLHSLCTSFTISRAPLYLHWKVHLKGHSFVFLRLEGNTGSSYMSPHHVVSTIGASEWIILFLILFTLGREDGGVPPVHLHQLKWKVNLSFASRDIWPQRFRGQEKELSGGEMLSDVTVVMGEIEAKPWTEAELWAELCLHKSCANFQMWLRFHDGFRCGKQGSQINMTYTLEWLKIEVVVTSILQEWHWRLVFAVFHNSKADEPKDAKWSWTERPLKRTGSMLCPQTVSRHVFKPNVKWLSPLRSLCCSSVCACVSVCAPLWRWYPRLSSGRLLQRC